MGQSVRTDRLHAGGTRRTGCGAECYSTVRPCAPDALHALLARNGFAVTRTWWDYGVRADARGAQFVTLLARPR